MDLHLAFIFTKVEITLKFLYFLLEGVTVRVPTANRCSNSAIREPKLKWERVKYYHNRSFLQEVIFQQIHQRADLQIGPK